MDREIVLMTGYPGAGKSTLAAALAADLGFPLISKDLLLGIIYEAMGFEAGDYENSLRSGAAAWAVFWTLGRALPQVVLDSNIKPASAYERAQVEGLGGVIVEVHCQVPPALAQRRYAERAARAPYPAMRTAELPAERLRQYDGSLGIGRRVVVDTSRPWVLEDVVARVQQAFNTV